MDTKVPGGGKRDPGEGQAPEGEKKEFDLWRILTTPEELIEEEGAPKRPAAAAPTAREPVQVGVPDEETVVYCRKHPETQAVGQCPVCAAYYCKECLIIKRGRLLCKTCAESIFAPTEAEVIEHGENAYQEHGDFLPQAPPEFNPSAFGIGSEGRLANVFKRVFGYAIDICIARFLYIVGYIFLSLLFAGISKGAVPSVLTLGEGNILQGMRVVVTEVIHYRPLFLILFLDFLYFFISYSIANRTLGMSWLNMRIVSIYGDFVGIGSSALRSLILVVTLGFSIIIAFVHPRAMGLHDMAAGTYVINYSGIKRVDVYETVNVKLE